MSVTRTWPVDVTRSQSHLAMEPPPSPTSKQFQTGTNSEIIQVTDGTGIENLREGGETGMRFCSRHYQKHSRYSMYPKIPKLIRRNCGGVCRNYDYVWTYNTEYYEDQLLTFTEEVYRAGLLRLFRVRRTKNPVCIPPVQQLNKRVDGAKQMRRCEVLVMRNLARCGRPRLPKNRQQSVFGLRG